MDCGGVTPSSARASSNSPAATLGRSSAFCAAVPPRFRTVPPSQTVANIGLAASVRPVSSVTTPKPLYPNAKPPCSSGNGIPAQPSSAICDHVSRSKPSALSSSRSLRNWPIDAFSSQKLLAESLSMFLLIIENHRHGSFPRFGGVMICQSLRRKNPSCGRQCDAAGCAKGHNPLSQATSTFRMSRHE